MLVKELKEALSHIPDDYQVLMENSIDGQVIEWNNLKNKTKCTGYSINHNLEFKDYRGCEDTRMVTCCRYLGGCVVLFNSVGV